MKIVFTNGLIIEVEQNGDCFIVDEKPNFPSALKIVTVLDNDDNEYRVFHNAEIIECASIDGRYWFAFRELTLQQLWQNKITANLDYLAMMADIDLDE